MKEEISNEQYLPCPFCWEKPTVTKETKYHSSWDWKILKYPDVWIYCKCRNEWCIWPSDLSTMNYRPVSRKTWETREIMINKVENEVMKKSIKQWNTRK